LANKTTFEAEQARINAGASNAASQRKLMDTQQNTNLLISKARATGAAGGVNVGTGSSLQNQGDIGNRGRYAAALDLWNGQHQATAELNKSHCHCKRKRTSGNNAILRLGGEGGIRTPDTVARMPHFECGAFNHSATSPQPATTPVSLAWSRVAGGVVPKPVRRNKGGPVGQARREAEAILRGRSARPRSKAIAVYRVIRSRRRGIVRAGLRSARRACGWPQSGISERRETGAGVQAPQ
jgi:hypothetical protein